MTLKDFTSHVEVISSNLSIDQRKRLIEELYNVMNEPLEQIFCCKCGTKTNGINHECPPASELDMLLKLPAGGAVEMAREAAQLVAHKYHEENKDLQAQVVQLREALQDIYTYCEGDIMYSATDVHNIKAMIPSLSTPPPPVVSKEVADILLTFVKNFEAKGRPHTKLFPPTNDNCDCEECREWKCAVEVLAAYEQATKG